MIACAHSPPILEEKSGDENEDRALRAKRAFKKLDLNGSGNVSRCACKSFFEPFWILLEHGSEAYRSLPTGLPGLRLVSLIRAGVGWASTGSR